MSSERPRTPPVVSTCGDDVDSSIPNPTTSQPTPTGENKPKAPTKWQYVPHLFDLVTPAQYAEEASLPSIFREPEAVDSSVLLGSGASFSASLQKIPPGPETIEYFADMGGWTTTKISPAPKRPEFVVYKVARIAFDVNGEPLSEYRRALQSVLTEYHALIYPPLYKHENIIKFLGFAWGSNPFSPPQRLPAIIVEYADHGTLADLFQKDKDTSLDMRQHLCLDVARGVDALHRASLIHGDIKAENVLVCTHKVRQYVAKIADFGYSVVETADSGGLRIGGTYPWKAPETDNVLLPADLKQTDVFSLGLLVWLIALKGQNPFSLLVPPEIVEPDRAFMVQEMKQDDVLLAASAIENWLQAYIHTDMRYKVDFAYKMLQDKYAADAQQGKSNLVQPFEGLKGLLYEQTYQKLCKDGLFAKLDNIFQHSLGSDPKSRSLSALLSALESNKAVVSRY